MIKMIKFAHTSDWHLGKRHLNNHERYIDSFRAVKRMVDQIIAEKVDFVLISGDMLDRPNPSAQTFNLLTKVLEPLNMADIPIYLIRGNHDAPADRPGDNFLMVLQRFKAVNLLEDNKVDLFINGQKISIFGIGYAGKDYNDKLNQVLKDNPINPDKYNILMLHASVIGVGASDNREIFKSEEEVHFGEHTLSSRGFNYVALGHHHKSIIKKKNNSVIAYCGATEHWNTANWEEIDIWTKKKNWLLVTIDKQQSTVKKMGFKVRPKLKVYSDLSDQDPEKSIDKVKKRLISVNEAMEGKEKTMKPIISFTYKIGFNQIDYNNPFFNWRELIPNLLIACSDLRIIDIDLENIQFKTQDKVSLIDNYLESRFPKKKEIFKNAIIQSLEFMKRQKEEDDDILFSYFDTLLEG